MQVCDYLSRGFSEKEIAYQLHISVFTVANHIRHIKEKFGLQKNIEVVLLYICAVRGIDFNLEHIRDVGIASVLI